MVKQENNRKLAVLRKSIDANMDSWLRLSKEVDQLQSKLAELVREEKRILALEIQADTDLEARQLAKLEAKNGQSND